MGAIDLSLIPAPVIVEPLDYEAILAGRKADLTARGLALDPPIDFGPVLGLESEPLTKLLEADSYRELVLRSAFNQRARGGLLAYAVGGDLDNLVANFDVVREAGESDAALRARTLLAPGGWSTCGPTQAYVFRALSADARVSDVQVSSPTPGQVRVAVLASDPTGVAAADLLAAVDAALSPDDVRPLGDQVVVVSAAVATYDVTATLVVGSGPDGGTVYVAAIAAVQAYAAAQRKLGAPIRRSAITAALMQPGAADLQLASPAADLVGVAETAPVLGALALTLTTEGAA